MKKTRTWNLLGILLGAVIIIVGVVFYAAPPETFSTYSVSDAAFGADFYTYEYEATQAAARNAAITANNIRELGTSLAHYAGFFFMAAGFLTVIHFGKNCYTGEAASPAALGTDNTASAPCTGEAAAEGCLPEESTL